MALCAGVDSQISRCEKSKERECEQAARERKRRKPSGKETTHNTTINDMDLTSAERTEHRTLDEGRNETGRTEQRAAALILLFRFDLVLPDNKCRTAKHDPD